MDYPSSPPPSAPPVLSPLARSLVQVLSTSASCRARALTARQLKVYGFSDRELRALAQEAAAAGIVVCADNAGYFLPASREEADACIGRLRSQGREMLARAETLAALAASLPSSDLAVALPSSTQGA